MASTELLGKLRARALRPLLEALCQAGGADPEGSGAPVLTLHLRSGRDLTGRPIHVAEERGSPGAVVLLRPVGGARGAPTGEVTYVELGAVEGVTVHDAAAAIGPLSGGELEPPPEGPVPTRLGLGRRCVAMSETLSRALSQPLVVEIDWTGISATPEALYSLGQLIGDAEAALSALIATYGASEIAPKLASLRFHQAMSAQVQRRGDALSVGADLDRGRGGRMDKDGLKGAMEGAL